MLLGCATAISDVHDINHLKSFQFTFIGRGYDIVTSCLLDYSELDVSFDMEDFPVPKQDFLLFRMFYCYIQLTLCI